jgi:pimeloyl-ACP methyl ester carboxylesterase
MSTIEVNGATIAYTDTGPPDGRPSASTVLFGHGLLFSGWVFHPQIAALRAHYRCVAVDWRGQGDTPPTPGGYDMETLTDDVIALIRALDIAPVHWVGLSMGGFIGQRIAARYGALLRSLTLLDTSAEAEDPAAVGAYKRLARFQQLFGIRPIIGRVKPLMFGPTFLADPDSKALMDTWLGRLNRLDRSAVRKAVLGVANRAAVEQEISRITVPTLIVVGADDKATPPSKAEGIADRIPGSQLQIVPDCGHTSSLEQPATITGLLDKFLATVDRD